MGNNYEYHDSEESLSPFHIFMCMSRNMPHIWEKIMSHLSATDVARCFKLCTDARTVIGHCLETNSKFRESLDRQATATAMNNNFTIKEDIQIFLEGIVEKKIVGLDGNLLLKYENKTGDTNLLRIQTQFGKKLETSFSNKWSEVALLFQLEYQTETTRGAVFVKTKDSSKLCKAANPIMEVLPMSKLRGPPSIESTENWHWKEEVQLDPHIYWKPYRLFRLSPKSCDKHVKIVMMPTTDDDSDSNKTYDSAFTLYEFNIRESSFFVLHLASNEEAKMVIILPHLIAVHDTRTGDAIWQNECNVDPWDFLDFFITKDITGYFYCDGTNQESGTSKEKVKIYSTKTGELISDRQLVSQHDLQHANTGAYHRSHAKGSLLCSIKGLNIHVIKISRKCLETYNFVFPKDHFAQTNVFRNRKKLSDFTVATLVGFVGRSNVLIGNLRDPSGNNDPELFSLDLDKGLLARSNDDFNEAFHLPFCEEKHLNNEKHFGYQPIYMTNKDSVDLVGVVKQVINSSEGIITLRTHNFVTDIQHFSV